jgi:carbonic anhydrase
MKRSSVLEKSPATSAGSTLEKLKQGVKQFQENSFEASRDLFESLAAGQKPHTLMITCADSRIRPNVITGSQAGDLFTLRNIANIVPPCVDSGPADETAAVIEYAVEALRVEHIVIMGHTDCGGVKALLQPEKLSALPTVSNWLSHAAGVADNCHYGCNSAERLEQAAYPVVAAAVADGRLQIHGWVYEIATGNVSYFEKNAGQWRDLTE